MLQFQPYPQGDFSWHHLWFIVYLYVYVLLLLPLLLWWRVARKKVVKPGAWLFALGLPLGLNEALLKPLFPETHNLVSDWYIFNHYLLLTVYGCVLASMRDAWDWLATRRQLSLGITLVVFGIAMLLFETGAIAPRHAGGCLRRQHLHLGRADDVHRLRPALPVVLAIRCCAGRATRAIRSTSCTRP